MTAFAEALASDIAGAFAVLATGFGVEDVPGMDSLHAARSQEEEERQLQLEEEKEKNKERIRKADTVKKEDILPCIAKYNEVYQFADIVPVSENR